MRISDDMINNLLTGYLVQNKSAIFALQQKAASGKKVQYASDDPSAYESIRRLNDQGACNLQKQRNSDQLMLDLTTMDGALQGVGDILQRAGEITTASSDGTKTPADRVAMGKEVDMLLKQMLDLGNTSNMGRYIFAGLRVDQPAYTVTTTGGLVSGVTYQGNTGIREVEIGKFIPGSAANRVEANIPGSDSTSSNAIFENNQGNIFTALIELRDKLLSGQNPIGTDDFTADPVTDQLTVNYSYNTGDRITLSSTGTLPGVAGGGTLKTNVTYYAIRIDATHVQLATSYANAQANTAIDLTDAGSGTHSLTPDFLGAFSNALDQTLNSRADVGARERRVTLNNGMLIDQQANDISALQTLQDIDIAKTTIEMSQQQTAYEAALKIIASTMRMSMVDYV